MNTGTPGAVPLVVPYQATSKRVYLAGGMHRNWRDAITKPLSGIASYYQFIDPMTTNLKTPEQYTYWDLRSIEQCDILLGHMDVENPSGWGLNLEIGYAKALDKVIILVIPDDFMQEDKRARYFGMAVSCADVVTKTFADAVNFLKAIEYK